MPLPPIAFRPQRSLRANLALAVLPTTTVLVVFALVEHLSHQKLLFASLASSAFLIYLDPEHETSSVRTVVTAQTLAALAGLGAHVWGGGSPWAAGAAMIGIIFAMIGLRLMHPPAVSTALSFALSATSVRSVFLFGVCVLLVAGLVFVQQALIYRLGRRAQAERTPQ